MPGCDYTYKLIQLSIPNAIKLVVMSNRLQARFISVPQVWRTCLQSPMVCTYDSFWRACCKTNKHTVISGDDKAMLSKLGGLSNVAAHGTIVTVAACHKALQQFNISPELLAAFHDLKQNPASQTVLALPDHVMAACAQPSTNPSQLQMATPFPTTLPEFQPPAKIIKRYGLNAKHKQYLAARAPLSQQMQELKAWLTQPFMLSRTGAKQASSSWENISKAVQLFLGYCNEYQDATHPTLQLFLFPHLIAHYVSFLVAAKRTPDYVSNLLSHHAKVLQWWQTKPGGNHPSFDEGLKWLNNLRSQVMHLIAWALILVTLSVLL